MDQVANQSRRGFKPFAVASLFAIAITLGALHIPSADTWHKSPTTTTLTQRYSQHSQLIDYHLIDSSETPNISGSFRSLSSHTHLNYLTIEPLDGSIGRLGNFLFRYAAAKGIAQHNNLKLVLPDTDLVWKYRAMFNIDAAVASEVPDYNARSFVEVNERAWGHFDPNIFTLHPGKDVKLKYVYSQSFKYFQHIEASIREEFKLMGPHYSNASSLIRSLRYNNQNKTIISLHVRRGDFLLPNLNKFGYAVAPVGYFMRAINYFIKKYGLKSILFVVASDDRTWSMQNLEFQGATHFYTQARTAIDDFMTLLLSDHHIVSVGSFSWWLAWLGRGEVVYFKDWPRPGSPHAKSCNPEDYYPHDWKPMT